jgi:predicted enzyme related to lactoylglutathione lyase
MPVWQCDAVPLDVMFVGVPVATFDASVDWYSRLLGRPADMVVHPAEVMWHLVGDGWLYVVHDPKRAGGSLVALAVQDLEATIAEIGGRGIDVSVRETLPDAGRKATYVDPDGNTVSFIQVLATA